MNRGLASPLRTGAVARTTAPALVSLLIAAGCEARDSSSAEARPPGTRISGPPVIAGEPTLRLDQGPEDRPRAVFLLEGLSPSVLQGVIAANLDADRWRALFAVQVADGPRDAPPLLGRYQVQGNAIRFEPRFPLQPGLRYRARFDPAQLPANSGRPATGRITTEFVAAPWPAGPLTCVLQVYPTRDVLPENHLKFYVHFSAPMSRGEAYTHVRLIDDATGKPIDLPFLEIDQELWDPRQTRLTLLFDPARVKRGLASREEAGPILEEGKSYTLVIDRAWPDAQERPLRQGFRKSFRVGPPDDQPVDPASWTIQAPRAGSTEPLILTFPEPLDHAMLGRVLNVVDGDQRAIPGSMAISDEETRWSFTPKSAWKSGDHAVVVQTILEDLAGNTIDRPFEIDVFRPIERTITTETVTRSFRVAEGP